MPCCGSELCGTLAFPTGPAIIPGKLHQAIDFSVVVRCKKCVQHFYFTATHCPKEFGFVGSSKNSSWTCLGCVDVEKVPVSIDLTTLPMYQGTGGTGLPVDMVSDSLSESLRQNRINIITGVPGSGKTAKTPVLCRRITHKGVLTVLPTSAGVESAASFRRSQGRGFTLVLF